MHRKTIKVAFGPRNFPFLSFYFNPIDDVIFGIIEFTLGKSDVTSNV